jgi:hypothetical protein
MNLRDVEKEKIPKGFHWVMLKQAKLTDGGRDEGGIHVVHERLLECW